MSNTIFMAVFIVCTVTKDVILVNKIKFKMDSSERVKIFLTVIIKCNITIILGALPMCSFNHF